MGIENIPDALTGLGASIRKLKDIRSSLRDINEKKELDGSISRLQQEYNALQKIYSSK